MAKNYDSILGVIDILNDYSAEIQDGITKETQTIAKSGAKELRDKSLVNKKNTARRGSYAKGWTVKTEKGFGEIKCTIHNKTDYQLTHLLEKGHLTRNGSKTRAVVHIKPVEESLKEEYESNIKDIIRKAG